MATKLHLPAYPSAGEDGVQPAFRQNPGGGEIPGFEAFQFDFTDMTADQAPSVGSRPAKFGIDPTISTEIKQGSKYLTGGPWNRVLLFPYARQSGFEYSPGWAFDTHDYGNGVNMPVEGFKAQFYWGCYETGLQDQRWGAFNFYAGTTPDMDLSNPGQGYRFYQSSQTTLVRHFNRHLIDAVQVHLSDQDISGAGQTNYYGWADVIVDYVNQTVQTTYKDLQQGGETTSGVVALPGVETIPPTAYRYFGFHSTADPNNQGIKLNHGWIGSLTDDFPAHLTLRT